MAKISIIMATYKENETFLRQSIESILNQTETDFEFIIVLDNPQNVLHKKIINDYSNLDSRINFLINNENQGLTKSLNRALSLVSGEFIARMDADDISLEDRLEYELNYLLENNCDLIGGITEMINEEGEVIYTINKIPSDPEKIMDLERISNCIAHPTWFARKELFDSLGGYREYPLCEDYDFTIRAILKGFKLSNINKAVLKYRITQNSISRSNLYKQYLYMKFLTSEFSKGKIADIESANSYVEANYTEEKSNKYIQANVSFNKMLNSIEEKKYMNFIKYGFLSIFTSKDYRKKILGLLKLFLRS